MRQVPSSSETAITPSAAEMLQAVLDLGREIHLEMSEEEIIERFLRVLGSLFPGRYMVVRAIDLRASDVARVVVGSGEVRSEIASERLTIKRSSARKTRLKRALVASARVRLLDRWDSPFPHVAAGFAVPLVASGELCGLLDVGYPLGIDRSEDDEPLILPLVNHLSVALRNVRLHRETTILRDAQAKLIEHASALILGVDRTWRITVVSQALCRLTGFDKADLVGRDLRDWLPADERTELTQMFLRALSGGATDGLEVHLPTKDGSKVGTVWSMAAIGARDDVQAIVAVGQDQTRVRELQNQIIQAEKLATLGQLAAGVVHEINNPLTSITVYAEYLLKRAEARARDGEAVDSGDIEKLERIVAGAQRILTFARDLVQYAKPSGSEPQVVPLSTVVHQALSFCEHLFERSHVELTCALDDNLPPICVVPAQLAQVVINLVTNAVQACGSGGRVAVTSGWARDQGGSVAITVGDSGPGISENDRERVFEPFFTTKTDGDGTGLGLSIVRNIVDHHRGRIYVSASELGGAQFVCELPAGI